MVIMHKKGTIIFKLLIVFFLVIAGCHSAGSPSFANSTQNKKEKMCKKINKILDDKRPTPQKTSPVAAKGSGASNDESYLKEHLRYYIRDCVKKGAEYFNEEMKARIMNIVYESKVKVELLPEYRDTSNDVPGSSHSSDVNKDANGQDISNEIQWDLAQKNVTHNDIYPFIEKLLLFFIILLIIGVGIYFYFKAVNIESKLFKLDIRTKELPDIAKIIKPSVPNIDTTVKDINTDVKGLVSTINKQNRVRTVTPEPTSSTTAMQKNTMDMPYKAVTAQLTKIDLSPTKIANIYNSKVEGNISDSIEDIYDVIRLDQINISKRLDSSSPPEFIESHAGTYIAILFDKDKKRAYVMPRLPFTLDNHRYVSGAVGHIFKCSPEFDSRKRYDKVKLKLPAEFYKTDAKKWTMEHKGTLDLS